MAETMIVTPDQIEMRPGTRGYIKGLTVMHVNEGAPYITFLESAPNHYAQVHSHSEDEVMVVVMGRMLFNGRWCDVGSLIFVPAHQEYSYSTGDEGCRVALIRPKGRGTFENGREDIAGDPGKTDTTKPDSLNRSADDAAR
jgi:mannose-6-phosphate isomerase-like protein (cupin superfamily)